MPSSDEFETLPSSPLPVPPLSEAHKRLAELHKLLPADLRVFFGLAYAVHSKTDVNRTPVFLCESLDTAVAELSARRWHVASYDVREVIVLRITSHPIATCRVLDSTPRTILPASEEDRSALRALANLSPAEADAIRLLYTRPSIKEKP